MRLRTYLAAAVLSAAIAVPVAASAGNIDNFDLLGAVPISSEANHSVEYGLSFSVASIHGFRLAPLVLAGSRDGGPIDYRAGLAILTPISGHLDFGVAAVQHGKLFNTPTIEGLIGLKL